MSVDPGEIRARVRARLLGMSVAALEPLSPPERRIRVREEVMSVLRQARVILSAGAVTEVVN